MLSRAQVKLPAERAALFGALASLSEAPSLKQLLNPPSASEESPEAKQLPGKVFAFMSAFFKDESESDN